MRLLAFALVLFLGFSAQAQVTSRCAPHDDIVKHLANTYQEVLAWTGITNTGTLLELFVSAESGTWTIISTRPGSISCFVVAGRGGGERPAVRALELKA